MPAAPTPLHRIASMQRDPFGCTRRLLRPLAATLASPCLALPCLALPCLALPCLGPLARLPACPRRLPSSCGTSLLGRWPWQLQLKPTPHTGRSSAQHPVKGLVSRSSSSKAFVSPCLAPPRPAFSAALAASASQAPPAAILPPFRVLWSLSPSRAAAFLQVSPLPTPSASSVCLVAACFVWIRGTARRDGRPASLASARYSTQTSPLALPPLPCLAPTTSPPPPSIPTASFLPPSVPPRNLPPSSCLNPRQLQSLARPRRKSERRASITAHRSRDSFRHIVSSAVAATCLRSLYRLRLHLPRAIVPTTSCVAHLGRDADRSLAHLTYNHHPP
ncbi:hypothetical protein L1887_62523 [Cichorium endivia]|nr:hypothetical protein L1887_62523 [Cichorium endivia]